MADQEADYYKRLRARMNAWLATSEGARHKWADYLMLAPDFFHLLCKLSIEKEVPPKEKAKLAAAIAYFILPIDLMPEALTGPIGYLDDVALAAYVLNSIINKTDPEIVTRHWAGEADVLNVIQEILRVADDMVGGGLWKKIKGMVD